MSQTPGGKLPPNATKPLPPVSLTNALFNGVMSKYRKRFAKKIAAKGKGSDLSDIGVRITPGYLRFEANVSNGASQTIAFAVVQGDSTANALANPNPNEQRLSKNDEFVIESYSMALMKSATSSIANLSIAKLNAFPDGQIFTGTGEAAQLFAFYNGSLFIQIDGTVWTQQKKMYDFLYIPETQATPLITGVQNANPYSEWWECSTDRSSYPSITLRGNGKNTIQINLPSSVNLATGAASNTVNWAVMQVNGFLVQNASQFATQG